MSRGKQIFVAVMAIGSALAAAYMVRTNLQRHAETDVMMPMSRLSVGAMEDVPMEMRQPDPALSPGQVVRIQLEAIRAHGNEKSGLKTAYRFASPANREAVQNLDAFRSMIDSPMYAPMLTYAEAFYGPVHMQENEATMQVHLVSSDGHLAAFQFFLSLQTEHPYDACWMTDGVARLRQPRSRSPQPDEAPGVPL